MKIKIKLKKLFEIIIYVKYYYFQSIWNKISE